MEKGVITKQEVDALKYSCDRLNDASALQNRILNVYRLTDEFRRSYGEYLFSDNPERESIKRAKQAIMKYKRIEEVDDREYHDLIIDLLYSKYILGYYFSEYFAYGFENLAIPDRMEFLSEGLRNRYYDALNDNKVYNHILDDKFLAYSCLKTFYNRDVISIARAEDFDTFASFVNDHPRFLAKPYNNFGGHGIEWVDCREGCDARSIFDGLLKKYTSLVCEEAVIPAAYMKTLYPHSVNTIRVVTFYNGKEPPTILGAIARVGQGGAIVDNFSSGGIIADIDISTGTICADGYSKGGMRFKTHPDTGVSFRGFQIRDWDKLLHLVEALARNMSNVRLIGWDLAASEEKGWQVIEGNAHPWLEIHQMCQMKGIRRRFEEVTGW